MSRQTLGEACSRLSSGKSIPSNKVLDKGLYPVIGGNGRRGFTNSYNFEGRCAVIGRQGAACGNVHYFSGKGYMTEHAVVACAANGNDSHYLAYLLSTMNLGRLSGQSAQPGLSVRTLSKQFIDLPSLKKQRQVVELLGSLDEKIGVNTRANGYLAEIAEGIFEDWLHTAGGDSVPLSRIASFNPSTYATKEKWPTVVYIDTGSVTRNHFEDPVVINTAIEKLPSRARRKVENGDVLYSTVRPNQLHYGLMNNPPSNLLVSTGFTVVRDKAGVGGPFIYLALTRPSITEMLQSVAEQSTSAYPSIKSSDLGQIEIPEPTKEELGKIKPQLDNLFELIAQNERESRALRELRDALLPKLMSGEIDVSQIGLPTQPNSHLCER
ncbi:MAG: restriction endonuclease subunit S [Atopobiaceae bacterium]|nr:restriction endonuclease subunit S [Atopobiaceae bacterium]